MSLSTGKIGQILNTPIGQLGSLTKKTEESRVSNPFVSFKGNVLSADVFETTKPTSKNKLTLSAFVGSINDAFPTYRKAVESVIAFAGRMKEGFTATMDKITEIGATPVDFGAPGRAFMSGVNTLVDKFNVTTLAKKDVSTLDSMWGSLTEVNFTA